MYPPTRKLAQKPTPVAVVLTKVAVPKQEESHEERRLKRYHEEMEANEGRVLKKYHETIEAKSVRKPSSGGLPKSSRLPKLLGLPQSSVGQHMYTAQHQANRYSNALGCGQRVHLRNRSRGVGRGGGRGVSRGGH